MNATALSTRLAESLLAFAIGALLMHAIYGRPPASGAQDMGLPGHDSFYHVKMAAMIPEHGLIREFPWLRFCYFTDEGQAFVSHHTGFHLLLAPFVQLARRLTGDELAGGRWATVAFFGLTVMLFNLVLIRGEVPYRWAWMLLFLFMPYQFFTRHALVRAISPSLALMLLLVLALFARRAILTGVVVAAYIHLYLGGAMFAPVVVGLFALAQAVGPRTDRYIPWKLILGGAGGWFVGMLTYPYSGGALEFLRLQVFGSGLSPDISVGQEWNPYENLWWFAQMAGALLTVWTVALCARLRFGPALNAQELSLLLISLAFLVLTMKARRFVEYWPMFCLLSAAWLAAPLLRDVSKRAADFSPRGAAWQGKSARTPPTGGSYSVRGSLLQWILFAAAIAGAAGAAWYAFGRPGRNVQKPELDATSLVALGLCFLGLALVGRWRRTRSANEPMLPRSSLVSMRAGVVVAALTIWAVCFAAPQWALIQRDGRCRYDLPAIRSMMAFLKENSQPGDVIFTDDWDIFPVFFYHNSHNHYIVGLDPKFTHHRRPDLWERYVKISRGQVPADTSIIRKDESGKPIRETVHSRLEDIRDHFGARFVITDQDHSAFASKLAAAKHLAQLVYPTGSFAETRTAPFRVFRILSRDEAVQEDPSTVPKAPPADGLYLGAFVPLSVEQGWGDFAVDVSVGGGPIYVGEKVYAHGLGTHAPSKIEYRIPDGFDTFEARVGINRSTNGRGSIIIVVLLDDQEAFRSARLTGDSEAVDVRVSVGKARRLTLIAEATSDGNRFDHVDWAEARLVRDPARDRKDPQ